MIRRVSLARVDRRAYRHVGDAAACVLHRRDKSVGRRGAMLKLIRCAIAQRIHHAIERVAIHRHIHKRTRDDQRRTRSGEGLIRRVECALRRDRHQTVMINHARQQSAQHRIHRHG